MNKITHEGKEYEALPLDRISEITHAKLAGGKVVEARYAIGSICSLFTQSPIEGVAESLFDGNELESFGIQPLKLLPKVPVEFVATFALFDGKWFPLHHLDDGIAYRNCKQRQFRCVEVTK